MNFENAAQLTDAQGHDSEFTYNSMGLIMFFIW